MTPEIIQAGYQAGKDVFFGRINVAQAKDSLSSSHDIKERTATAYVEGFACMVTGRKYTQTLGIETLRYYLKNISIEFGSDWVNKAVASIREHVIYARAKMGSTNNSITALANEFEAAHIPTENAKAMEELAKKELDIALLLTSEERQVLLAFKPKKPTFKTTIRFEPVRSGLVIAEVLEKSKGICGGCNLPAPFSRLLSGKPYLEVHHLIRLADDGDDTVENAIALCPNCHRQEHFGLAKFPNVR